MKKVYILYYTPDDHVTNAQKWVCKVLNQCKFTQTELAKRLHCTRQMVSNLVNGRNNMTFDKVCAICYVTGIHDDPEEVWNAICWN